MRAAYDNGVVKRFSKEISEKVESASIPLCSGRVPTVEGCRVGGGDTAATSTNGGAFWKSLTRIALEHLQKEISEKKQKDLVLLQVISDKVVVAPSRDRA
jgi:hypothetical protein